MSSRLPGDSVAKLARFRTTVAAVMSPVRLRDTLTIPSPVSDCVSVLEPSESWTCDALNAVSVRLVPQVAPACKSADNSRRGSIGSRTNACAWRARAARPCAEELLQAAKTCFNAREISEGANVLRKDARPALRADVLFTGDSQ